MHGIVRILMDLPELVGVNRELSLRELVTAAERGFDRVGESVADATIAFGQERVRYALEQRGSTTEIVRGATAAARDAAPLRARRIATALQQIRTSEDFQALAVLFKRVKNIAKERTAEAALDRTALGEPAELALLTELDARRPAIEQASAAADYKRAFTEIAGLRQVVDRFFTEVFVMAEDARVRTARLTLMANLRDLILDLADISEIVPQTE
jgi:glycyl-tRNA synthetase beta chain